ncbi:hypothetical protein AVEN_222288-1 [Araneus ventricosus]|uniref:Uncharacterized protein n=1 Tax=Araneus ventricosus TaxID=182803 RepID=A0A4Y2UUQ7_ARAVE|nr:hypothetical protein AVEN_58065-1 [Araneus ventricosus]GBO16735.1 hypothetical protein AVEN_222288-1 [Araneus ventricosus]
MPVSIDCFTDGTNASANMVIMWENNMFRCLSTLSISDFVNKPFLSEDLLPYFLNYLRMPPMVACPPPPSMFERNRKNTTPLYILYGEKPSNRSPSPNIGPILINFTSYGSFQPQGSLAPPHLPFSRKIEKLNFGIFLQPLQPPIRQFISPSFKHNCRLIIL